VLHSDLLTRQLLQPQQLVLDHLPQYNKVCHLFGCLKVFSSVQPSASNLLSLKAQCIFTLCLSMMIVLHMQAQGFIHATGHSAQHGLNGTVLTNRRKSSMKFPIRHTLLHPVRILDHWVGSFVHPWWKTCKMNPRS